jgi:hypothetical protein
MQLVGSPSRAEESGEVVGWWHTVRERCRDYRGVLSQRPRILVGKGREMVRDAMLQQEE